MITMACQQLVVAGRLKLLADYSQLHRMNCMHVSESHNLGIFARDNFATGTRLCAQLLITDVAIVLVKPAWPHQDAGA